MQLDPVDYDPFAPTLEPVDHNPFEGQTISPTVPTWRDSLAQFLMGDTRPSLERSNMVKGMLGTTGIGDPSVSASDFTPMGGVFGAQEATRQGDYKGAILAGLGAMPGARMAEEGAGALEGAVAKMPWSTPKVEAPITAYHGSPYDFDAFKNEAIGTGEGAQAYGYGHYFAENEKTALGYKKRLAGDSLNAPTPEGAVERALDSANGNRDEALKSLQGNLNGVQKTIDRIANMSSVSDDVRAYQNKFADNYRTAIDLLNNGYQPPGTMYHVGIESDPEHFLDWDKPLSEQSQHVQEALGSVMKKQSPWLDELPNAKGSDLYYMPGFKGQVGNSDALREAGIPGIKYLDQGSRWTAGLPDKIKTEEGILRDWQANAAGPNPHPQAQQRIKESQDALAQYKSQLGGGTRNYVVFNPDTISIIKKYGIGGLGIGTAGAISHFSTTPVDDNPF